MNSIRDLEKFAKSEGVELIARGEGHYQIKGKLLVNYYPNSRTRTAYVKGTTKGIDNVSPQQAVQMSLNVPKEVKLDQRDKRSRNTRKIRRAMFKGREVMQCHWCGIDITIDTSTIEHVIPLKRGGLDNANNRVLACRPCNENRGHEMPEIKK